VRVVCACPPRAYDVCGSMRAALVEAEGRAQQPSSTNVSLSHVSVSVWQ
jgi:hypothetical protein